MKRTSNDILPQPFAWIPIPEGEVMFISDNMYKKETYLTKYTVPAFEIAKYPVTNAQFQLFVHEGGYNIKRWWTSYGWYERERYGWTQPRYWDDEKWNVADAPVVGVSWYEAVAFCQWLSFTTGENIMIPSEMGWQHAAQGDKRLTYPWGNEWDASRCNNNSNQTTPVRQFEGKGDSPFGVVEMTGNVSEWCSNTYRSLAEGLLGTIERVLRGGSWNVKNPHFFDNTSRLSSYPRFRYYYWGFRIARFPK